MTVVKIVSKEELAEKLPGGTLRLRYAMNRLGRTDLMSVKPPAPGLPQMRYITLEAYKSLWPEPNKHVIQGLGTNKSDTVYLEEVDKVLGDGTLIKAINECLKKHHLAVNPAPSVA